VPQASLLRLRRPYDQTVEFLGYRYLAAQAAVRSSWTKRGIQHFILVLLDRFEPGQERFIHVDVTGGALARAPTLGDNAVYSIADGAFHHRVANRHQDLLGIARMRDVGNSRSFFLFLSKETHDRRHELPLTTTADSLTAGSEANQVGRHCGARTVENRPCRSSIGGRDSGEMDLKA